ncbi:MAG: hypothetical protein HKO71_01010 [Pseudomonadales bacterium]|nr:hypothetical protein [Gammaproteobacteria bacterium]NNL56305.1 hypothetical protein [Pseudomonadales bacterium]
MQSLQALMQEHLPDGGVAIPGARDLHIEVIEVANGRVWMSVEPATQQDYDALLAELDESLQGIGIGAAAMDAALFRFSPDGEGEAVRERTLGGQRYINVAIPGQPSKLPGGMLEIMVNKAHVLGYEAGRTVTILSTPEGDFVEVVGTAGNDSQITLADGSSLKQLVLEQPWIVPLPTPTKTLWNFDFGMRSFQGPVTLPEQDR